jgi:hypothetical protein
LFCIGFFTASVTIFLNNQPKQRQVSTLSSSSIDQSNESSQSLSQLNSKSSSESSISISSSVSTAVVVSNSSSVSGQVKTDNNITLEGGKCNGIDDSSTAYAAYTGYCKIIDQGQETGRIYFNQTQSSLKPIQGSTFQPQANGYFYVEKLKKTGEVQYIRWVYGTEYGVYGGVIYKYDFKNKKLSHVEELYFNWLNYPGQSPRFEVYDKPECKSINLPTFWDYSCFYIIDNYMTEDEVPRYALTDEEKDTIDKTKKEYLYYIQQAPIYGLPSL